MGHFRSLLNGALQPLGYSVVKGPPPTLAWHLRALFRRLGVNCVVDVGAHHGEYGRFLRKQVRYEGRIVSFEPSTENFARLERRAAHDSAWRCRRAALGAGSGQARLRVLANSQLNSLLPTSGDLLAQFGAELDERRIEDVPICTLDEVYDECIAGIARPRVYLKLDTQGSDQDVVTGAVRSLLGVAAMQTEVAVSHLYAGAPRLGESLDRLARLGFLPTGFFPVTKATDGVHVIEFDCVLARQPLPTG